MEEGDEGIDLHNQEGEKEGDDEESHDQHEKEGDEVRGHCCGQDCGQMVTGYGLCHCDLLKLLCSSLWGWAMRTWIQMCRML